MDIAFHKLGFTPDADPTIPGFSLQAKAGVVPLVDMDNWYPTQRGLRTLPGLAAVSNALPSPAVGAFLATSSGGAQTVYAGTSTHLWKLLSGGIWAICDNGSLVVTTGRWRFAQFLDDVIAIDSAQLNPPQVSQSGGIFQPLGGNPPNPVCMCTVDVGGIGIFAIFFNFNNVGDQYGTSGIGNDTDWNFNIQTLGSTQRESAVPGPFIGAASLHQLAFGFKVNGVAVGVFQGGSFPWNFTWISQARGEGCQSQEAIVSTGDILAWVGNDNFYYSDGSGVYPIPNLVRDWFFKTLNLNYASSIIGEYDTQNAVVYWHFSSINANPAGTIDTWVSYNPLSGRWAKGLEPFPGGITATLGVLPNSFDLTWGEFGNLYLEPSYASPPAGLQWGSPSFSGSPVDFRGIIAPNGVLYAYALPTNKRSPILTGDNGYLARKTQVNRLMPKFSLFPTAPPMMSPAKLNTYIKTHLGSQKSPNQNGKLFKQGVNIGPQGWFDFIETDRWHRFEIEVATDSEILGYTLEVTDGGER